MLGTDGLVNGLFTHEDEQCFKHVEEVARIGLVPCLERLCEDLDHGRKEVLEGFLISKLEGYKKGASVSTHNVGFIICVDVLGDSTEGSGNNSACRGGMAKKESSPDSSHPDFGTLGISKEIFEEFEEAL
jgi:hypothetical protein